jgi:hypothetical protein
VIVVIENIFGALLTVSVFSATPALIINYLEFLCLFLKVLNGVTSLLQVILENLLLLHFGPHPWNIPDKRVILRLYL